jgi:tetratricopeptide (TPR) repeat protein
MSEEENLLSQADALMRQGGSLAAAGRRAEAVAATEQGVAIYRRLARADPRSFASRLASSLADHSANLLDVERREEARAAVAEAVTIYRGLSGIERAAVADEYARACCNLGWIDFVQGNLDSALAATRDSEAAFRQLARADRGRYEHELPTVLVNAGMIASALGRDSDAVNAEREALAIARRLSPANPAVVARTLVILSAQLHQSGHAVDALSHAEEAVKIYRELARGNPMRFEPFLDAALRNLAAIRDRLSSGRIEDDAQRGQPAGLLRNRRCAACLGPTADQEPVTEHSAPQFGDDEPSVANTQCAPDRIVPDARADIPVDGGVLRMALPRWPGTCCGSAARANENGAGVSGRRAASDRPSRRSARCRCR